MTGTMYGRVTGFGDHGRGDRRSAVDAGGHSKFEFEFKVAESGPIAGVGGWRGKIFSISSHDASRPALLSQLASLPQLSGTLSDFFSQ